MFRAMQPRHEAIQIWLLVGSRQVVFEDVPLKCLLLDFDPIPEIGLTVLFGHLSYDRAQTDRTILGLEFDRLADSEFEAHLTTLFLDAPLDSTSRRDWVGRIVPKARNAFTSLVPYSSGPCMSARQRAWSIHAWCGAVVPELREADVAVPSDFCL